MKKSKILTIDLEEEILKSKELAQSGGNYEEGSEPEINTESVVRFFVNDITAGLVLGPFFSFETAEGVAERRQKKFPSHQIIIQQTGAEAAMADSIEANGLDLRFWVLHFEKDRRYGPYFSFGTAMGVMTRKKKEFPNDRFDIEEEEFSSLTAEAPENLTADAPQSLAAGDISAAQIISVRVFFSAQGLGSFRAGNFNTSNGDASGFFRAGSAIRLSASAAQGHRFSHWTFDGNFGGDQPSRTVRARRGMKIVGVFVKA